jgi:phospholipid transport system substrate-binding protein
VISRRHFLVVGLAAAGAMARTKMAIAATPPEGAAKFVRRLADEALATLNQPGGSLAQREAVFQKLLREGFDLKLIGRFVLGRYWRTATPGQRNDFQRLFEEFVIKSYSYRLGGYKGEDFTIVSARAAGEKDALVRTRIVRPSGPPITADWRVRAKGDRFRIIDVMVEGVSMAVTQRSEFAAVISRGGFNGLIEALRARVQRFAAAQAK